MSKPIPSLSPETWRKIIRIELDIAFILLGILFMLGGKDAFFMDIGPPLAITVTGIVMLGAPKTVDISLSLLVLGVGLFMLLRATGIIMLPLLRYALGSFVVSVSAVNLLRNMKGGTVSWTKTFFK